MLQVLHLETIRETIYFKFSSWVKVQSEQITDLSDYNKRCVEFLLSRYQWGVASCLAVTQRSGRDGVYGLTISWM